MLPLGILDGLLDLHLGSAYSSTFDENSAIRYFQAFVNGLAMTSAYLRVCDTVRHRPRRRRACFVPHRGTGRGRASTEHRRYRDLPGDDLGGVPEKAQHEATGARRTTQRSGQFGAVALAAPHVYGQADAGLPSGNQSDVRAVRRMCSGQEVRRDRADAWRRRVPPDGPTERTAAGGAPSSAVSGPASRRSVWRRPMGRRGAASAVGPAKRVRRLGQQVRQRDVERVADGGEQLADGSLRPRSTSER